MKLVAVGTEFGMSVVIMTLVGYLSFKEFFGEDFAALGVTVGIFIGFFTGVYTLYREFCKKLLK
jgi:predicted membrane chloride channel (bestrophin family)